MTFRSRNHRARGPVRKTLWVPFELATSVIASGAATIIHTVSAGLLALRPFTIVRTLLSYQLESDQAAAIEHQMAGTGVAVVSDQAVAVGVTAVPTPTTDMGSDLWFIHQLIFGDESALTDRTRSATRVLVESKAMRKVQDGEDIVHVIEADTLGDGITIRSGGRMLIKLN